MPKSADDLILKPYNSMVVEHSVWLLQAVGIEASVDVDKLEAGSFSLRIGEGCNALYEMTLFLSAVVAYTAPYYYKIAGITAGFVFIYLLNLFRIVTLFLINVYLNDYFQITHDQIYQSLFVLLVAILWLFWAALVHKRIPISQ
jgi:exosortase/archaeosortase family protein